MKERGRSTGAATKFLHTEAFTHRSFYTDAFTHRRFYTQKLFTHRHFHTHRSFYTDAFTHRSFYTQKLLHTEAFTHRSFYTQTLLHTDAFTHRPFNRTNQTRKKPSVLDTRTLFRAKGLPPDQPNSPNTFSSWHSNLISCERVAAEDVKSQFYPSFDTRTSFRAKWLPPRM